MLKTLGIGLVFLVCFWIGTDRSHRAEERCRMLETVCRDLGALLVCIRSERLPLRQCIDRLPEGWVRERLSTVDSGQEPTGSGSLDAKDREELDRFFRALQKTDAGGVAATGEAALARLNESLASAKKTAEQSRLFRTVGALCGAVLAVLLW